nr:MAG TPA: hypothetical protein [Caudoviricetes sp.]
MPCLSHPYRHLLIYLRQQFPYNSIIATYINKFNSKFYTYYSKILQKNRGVFFAHPICNIPYHFSVGRFWIQPNSRYSLFKKTRRQR